MNKNKKTTQFIAIIVIVLMLAVGGLAFWQLAPTTPKESLDEFAKCLAEKGVVVYGTYWCPVCQEQNAMFGDALKFVRYIECTEYPQVCTDAGIKGFPTWIFPDGRRLEGIQSLEELSENSNCPLPDSR